MTAGLGGIHRVCAAIGRASSSLTIRVRIGWARQEDSE